MLKQIHCFSLVILLLITNISYGQLKSTNSVVKGHIVDSKTKAPIAYAIVRIPKTGKYVMTNNNGDFEMQIPRLYWRQKELKLEITANNYKQNLLEFDTKKHKETKVFVIYMKNK